MTNASVKPCGVTQFRFRKNVPENNKKHLQDPCRCFEENAIFYATRSYSAVRPAM